MSSKSSRFAHLEPGDKVAVRFAGALWHYGVVTHRRTVISNSRRGGGVTEESLEAFADGRPIRLCDRRSGLDALAVEHRARRALGADYDVVRSNCSHFTRWTYREIPTALQVASATFAAIGDIFRQKSRY